MNNLITNHQSPITKSGFSLIGVLVSLFFLVFAGIMIAQVISRTKDAAARSRQVFIATHLAREGSELVQAIRDSNWFAYRNGEPRNWIHSLCDVEGTPINPNTFALDATGVYNQALPYLPGESQLYQTPDGEWTHNASGAVATRYSRLISIVCTNQHGISIEEPGFITVTSTVTWTEKGQVQSVITRSKLYNWLRIPE